MGNLALSQVESLSKRVRFWSAKTQIPPCSCVWDKLHLFVPGYFAAQLTGTTGGTLRWRCCSSSGRPRQVLLPGDLLTV